MASNHNSKQSFPLYFKFINSITSEKQNKQRGSSRKFGAAEVIEIRKLLMCGVPIKQLARKFTVCTSTIRMIRDGKRYKDVIN